MQSVRLRFITIFVLIQKTIRVIISGISRINYEEETASKVINGKFFCILKEQNVKRWVFLAVAETIIGSLMFGGVGIV